jgi:geranylgeranyl diphosphate synthase, type III
LFRLAIGLLHSISNETEKDFEQLVNALSCLFQILDDYLNLQSKKYHENKSFCEDFTEGKFSFPIIHHIKNSKDSRVLNILKKKTSDVDLKKYALSVMNETNSFEYTLLEIKKYYDVIVESIKELGGNEFLMKIVNNLMLQIKQDIADVDFKKL